MRVAALLLLACSACVPRRAASTQAELESAQRLLRSEQYTAAMAKAELGFRASANARDAEIHSRFWLLRAEILLELRDAQKAEAVLREGQIPQRSPELHARYLLLAGHAQYRLGHIGPAKMLLDEAQRLAEAAGLTRLLPEVEFRRAAIFSAEGNFGPAEAGFRRVAAEAGQMSDPYLRAITTASLGLLLLRQARYDEALTVFDQARSAFQSTGGASSRARIVGNMGWCNYRLGDLDKALARFEEASAAFAAIGNRHDAEVYLGNEGSVFVSRLDYVGAMARYQQALDLARALKEDSSIAEWLSNMAYAKVEVGEIDAAEKYNEEARGLKERLGEKRTIIYNINNSARIAARRANFGEAERLFQRASAAASEDPTAVLEANAGLARLYSDNGRPADAVAQYRKTLALIEQPRSILSKPEFKLSYLASLIRFYRDYVDFLMASGRKEAALEAAESSRARLLTEKIGSASGSFASGAGAYRRLASTSHSILLSYWLGGKRSFLWAVTPSGIAVHQLPAEAEICRLVDAHNALIRDARDPLRERGPDTRLFDVLLSPVRDALRLNGRVIVVPDGCLHALNLETLPVSGGAPHYVIDDATVMVTPSLNLLAPATGGRANGPLLLIGNPRPATPEFPALKFAGSEMEGIEKALPGATVIQGDDARPPAYARETPERFGMIHFVAHAVANVESPLDSAVILSGGPEERKLFARNIMAVKLRARVVTISACRGAGARVYAGEGLVGLAWAFLHAGARNVVAGLWDVDDRSTAELMRQFYSKLAAGAAPAEALRDAKMQMAHSDSAFQKPYYWGPFQIYTRAPE
jgi:CHAT domain-containing protein